MGCRIVCAVTATLTLQIICAAQLTCPSDPNCICGGTLDIELNCSIDGRKVKINLLPHIYINIKCENATDLDYSKLPKCVDHMMNFRTVSFKDCPLPSSSFKDVLTNMGVSKSMALIFQNGKNLSRYFDRKHFAGLQDLKKLLLSINGVTHLPDNLFVDINKLTWLNIRSNSINLSEELFKPLERLETLEISHNHMTNISSNLFSHLSFLRKLSLWQSNVTWFSKDLFSGVDVLEELDLSSNGLNELPASIFKPLKRLKKLTLFSNKFSSLPQNLFKNNSELETVVILNNDVKLQELPKNMFGNLAKLRQINIQRSGLEKLPSDVFANSSLITNLSLAYNDIRTLPESTFNDQINLLELDLSYNKLNDLAPKLFSSLVRLEKLNLCHNSLVHICSSTFMPLLSLIYLNMEHNKLTSITPYLFSNNKQRMSISLAYNRLQFVKSVVPYNNTFVAMELSPFDHTFNLRLLNLSHNELREVFKDWWINGHESVDISYNYIENLWDENELSDDYEYMMRKKPIKYVSISYNPIKCECRNYIFLDSLLANSVNKIDVMNTLPCSKWSNERCYMRFSMLIILFLTSVTLYLIILIVFKFYGKNISLLFKKVSWTLFESNKKKNLKNHCMIVKICDEDNKFFKDEIVPVLERCQYKNYITDVRPSIGKQVESTIMVKLPWCCTKEDTVHNITIVIFSPNYLTSTYSHVDIKKIHTEMLKAENTIYVFADIGLENSIYAFLKDQRDQRTTVVYNEPNFMEKFIGIMKQLTETVDNDIIQKINKSYDAKTKLSAISVSRASNELKINYLNTPIHSQV